MSSWVCGVLLQVSQGTRRISRFCARNNMKDMRLLLFLHVLVAVVIVIVFVSLRCTYYVSSSSPHSILPRLTTIALLRLLLRLIIRGLLLLLLILLLLLFLPPLLLLHLLLVRFVLSFHGNYRVLEGAVVKGPANCHRRSQATYPTCRSTLPPGAKGNVSCGWKW